MKKLLIICIPIICFAQPMEYQPSSIQVDYLGQQLHLPFFGGTTNASIAFADMDKDGDLDCYLGSSNGNICHLINEGNLNSPIFRLSEIIIDTFYTDHVCSPAVCDIDNDNDNDLFIADWDNWAAWYFNNTGGISTPQFSYITDSLEGISYNSNLDFKDMDNDGDYDLVIGNDYGQIHYLRNDGTPEQYNFTVVTQNLVGDVGSDAAPALVDIDGDEDLDLFVGTGEEGVYTSFGGIRYFENIGTPEVYNFQPITNSYFDIDCGWTSNPCLVDIDNDSDLDLFIGGALGNLSYYENTGTLESPAFTFRYENYPGIAPAAFMAPAFADLDADGDYDLLHGWLSISDQAKLAYYSNVGDANNPQFELITYDLIPVNDTYRIGLSLCDLDSDGDLDLLIGKHDGTMDLYWNTGDSVQFRFNSLVSGFSDIDVGNEAQPLFYDIDEDNDYDLFLGYYANVSDNPGIFFYNNIGDEINPIYVYVTNYWEGITARSFKSAPFLADIDDDGDSDLFLGSESGGVQFYRNLLYNNAVQNPSILQPSSYTLQPCYPNPFNPTTTITFTLDRALPVKLAAYNQLGQQVLTIINNQVVPGDYKFIWDAGSLTSGIYYISLETQGQKQTQKVILLK